MTVTWRPWQPAYGITTGRPGAAHVNPSAFEAGTDGEPTSPSAATIVSTRLGIVRFIHLVRLDQRAGKFFRRALTILE